MRNRWRRQLAMLLILAGGMEPTAVLAQESTPAAGDQSGVTLAASGLANPRGFTWDAGGVLHVALAGVGGTTVSGMTPTSAETADAVMSGATASAVKIVDGCPVTIASGLPSTRGMSGHDQGPASVAVLDGQIYLLQDAAGGTMGETPPFPNGVYAVEPDGGVRLVADLTSWIRENPVSHIPYDQTALGEPFAMVAAGGVLWVAESNNGQVLRVTAEGDVTRLVDLSNGHPVPTGIAIAPDGDLYVGFLTPIPYPNQASRVVKIGADGEVTEVWTGLTMVTALAVGPDGALYALEMATGNTTSAPYVYPDTGRIVRQTGPASQEEVATGLNFPISMAFGPDGGLYVGYPAFGADDQPGGIARIDLASSLPVTLPPDLLATSPCAVATPAAEAMAATPEPPAMAAATPATTETAPAAATPAGTPVAHGKDVTGAVAVAIQNFAFDPAPLTVPVGTTVTWTNLDSVPHTVTATGGAFNSSNLDPGAGWSFTFDQPGTYSYVCSYHPNMMGTITVQ